MVKTSPQCLRVIASSYVGDIGTLCAAHITDAADEIERLRDALSHIETHGCDLDRYRNMKAFPVVMGLGKRLTNTAADALGHSLPFPEPEFSPRGQLTDNHGQEGR